MGVGFCATKEQTKTAAKKVTAMNLKDFLP
jgi:hypothetical protein